MGVSSWAWRLTRFGVECSFGSLQWWVRETEGSSLQPLPPLPPGCLPPQGPMELCAGKLPRPEAPLGLGPAFGHLDTHHRTRRYHCSSLLFLTSMPQSNTKVWTCPLCSLGSPSAWSFYPSSRPSEAVAVLRAPYRGLPWEKEPRRPLTACGLTGRCSSPSPSVQPALCPRPDPWTSLTDFATWSPQIFTLWTWMYVTWTLAKHVSLSNTSGMYVS